MDRVVFLVDMNAFFISCEMSRDHSLKGKPAAVAGNPKNRHGIVLAANYDARKFGVRTTMLVHEAKRRCPEIIFVPPDHEFYSIKSKEVMDILGRYSPVIQQNSIDEAWMDMTGCEALFGQPLEIARKIMDKIIKELDLWCSIGISYNKFLAKMASDLKKPLGITEIWRKDLKEKIWPLPVRAMYGIGKQTEKKLNDIGLNTIGDIARFDQGTLVKLLGKYGGELGRLANGIDDSPVTENPQPDSKSVSRSTTLSSDTLDKEYCKAVMLRLAEEVGEEARRLDYKGKTIFIVIKYGNFQTITRQRSVIPTCLTRDIYSTGVSLLEENWSKNRPIRLLGIGLGNMTEQYPDQVSLFDIAEKKGSRIKEEKLERAIDSIRERYGHDKVKRAKVIE